MYYKWSKNREFFLKNGIRLVSKICKSQSDLQKKFNQKKEVRTTLKLADFTTLLNLFRNSDGQFGISILKICRKKRGKLWRFTRVVRGSRARGSRAQLVNIISCKFGFKVVSCVVFSLWKKWTVRWSDNCQVLLQKFSANVGKTSNQSQLACKWVKRSKDFTTLEIPL